MKRKTKKSSGDRNRRVVVNDRIQKGFCYELSAPVGRNFDPEFKPELTPQQMLALDVFCGKLREFPKSWFKCANCQPTALRVAKQRMDPTGRSARLVPMVLPLLHGAPHAGGRQAPD
jgi:hypothetical protein